MVNDKYNSQAELRGVNNVPPPEKSSSFSKGFYVILGIVIGTIGLIAMMAFSCSAIVSAMVSASDNIESLSDEFAPLGGTEANVGVIEIFDTIMDSKKVIKDLRKFVEDEKIAAIVIRVDSPGGAVSPSQEIFSEIKKARAKKHIVVSMGTLAASGGYYIASAGEKIYAMPGTITGSIGVISQFMYIKNLLEWMKLEPKTYKSGKYKDSGSGLREFTPEDDALFNSLIQNIYNQFLQDVSSSRNIPVETLKEIADGRVLTGAQAKEYKLIDEFGSLYDAADGALALAGIQEKPKLVYPKKDKEEFLLELFDITAKGIYNIFVSSTKKPALYMMGNIE